jgi:exopolyphosphatase/pppGpp-phosphohydrolase
MIDVYRTRRLASIVAACGIALSVFFVAPAAAAQLHGGIEIGSKGVKATVVEVIAGDEIDLQTKLSETTNTALVLSLSKDGHFAPGPLAETVRAVKDYYDRFRKEYDVPPARIHIVGSSGLFVPIETKPDLVKQNQQVLSAAVAKVTGVTMDFIDVKREAELSIAGTLPKKRHKTGVLIDIGGGNTKGGYPIGNGKYATFGVPYGTLTFSEFAKKKGAGEGQALVDLGTATLPPVLKKELANLPEIPKRDAVYLSGGIVWATATFTHPISVQSYTALTLKDVEELEAKLLDNLGGYPKPDLKGVKDDMVRLRAAKEVERVKKTYTPEQLLAGTQVLKSTLRELGPGKRLYFARHGHLGWLLAYLTEATGGT